MVAENYHQQQPEAALYQRIVEQIPLAVAVWRAETDDPRDLRLVYVSPQGTAETGVDSQPSMRRSYPTTTSPWPRGVRRSTMKSIGTATKLLRRTGFGLTCDRWANAVPW